MSNRLTFSLASLILIFALPFVTMPAMAATGGPTVTLAEYVGVEDPAAAAAGQDNHVQARGDFRVLLTFSHSVAAPISTDVMYRSKGADGRFGIATAIDANPVAVLNSGGKKYVATLPAAAITDTTTQVNVSIADDAVSGDTTNLLGIVGNSRTFTLPPLNVGTVNLAAPKAVANTPGSYTIVATFDSKADPAATHTLSPAFAVDYVDIMPENSATATIGTVDTSTDNKAVVTITVDLVYGAENVMVSIDPGYVKGSNTITLPPPEPADPVYQNPPTVMLAVVSHNATNRSFQISVSTTPVADTDGEDGDAITGDAIKGALKIKDSSTPAAEIEVMLLDDDDSNESRRDNSYRAVLEYGRFDELPLTVSIDPNDLSDNDDAADVDPVTAMVGMAPDTTRPTLSHNAPRAPITAATTVTLTFSEPVSGVAVTGDPAGNVAMYTTDLAAGTGTTRTFTITPTAAADLTADVAERVISFTVSGQDAAGNQMAANAIFTVSLAARMAPDTGNGNGNGNGGAPADQADQIYIFAPSSSSDPINLGDRFSDTMIPAYGFAVLVRDRDGSGIHPGSSGPWLLSSNTSLPDLAWFFGGDGGPNTGTIILNGTGVQNKDLIISEIMWGRDSSLADETRSQWIEFYNATPTAIDLNNFTITFHRSQAFPSHAGAIDVVSNVGHVYFGNVPVPGSSGRSRHTDTTGFQSQPRNLVSMYRDLNHLRIKQQNVGNRGERNKGIPDRWKASEYESANIRSYHVATPGHEQIVRTRLANSSVKQRVIINEIGNSSTDAHDWIELYNTGAAISIENWEFMRVTGESNVRGTETFIARFPKVTIPANSYVVITNTHPRNQGNDLAAGIDLARSDADQLNRGLGSKPDSKVAYYLVDSELTLPNNNDKCLYILRNAHDREGQPTHIEDVVGTLGLRLKAPSTNSWTWFSADERRVWDTDIWPIQGKSGGPHGDVVTDAGPEHFGAGRVYQRNGKNSGTGEHHLSVRGYTGIGYDRIAAKNNENGGTPGYSNGALISDRSGWAGQVSFSEIMLETHTGAAHGRIPRATRLPQWLEIYNNSLTEGVNINNWYLEIQNADTEDLDTRDLHGTLRLPNMTIPPNQTILITTSGGLNSGHFPEQRLINLFLNGTYRNILTIQFRGDSVLSKGGFYIELRDHKGNHVDEIGNLAVRHSDPRRGIEVRDRGNFSTTWDIPSMLTEDGHRTSLIRIYDRRTPRDGLRAVGSPNDPDTSWILASDPKFRRVPSLTYYGNHQDYGTPGYRGGGPLPVQLSTFRPQRLDDGTVVIRWVTESELNNAGFNILRSDTRDGEFTKINTELIAGNGTTSERNAYEFTDTSAKPNVVYYYQIQDVSVDGDIQTLRVTRLRGHVSATGKATTTWGELKSLQ